MPVQSTPRTSSNTCGAERWVMPGQGLGAVSGEGVTTSAGPPAAQRLCSPARGPHGVGGNSSDSGDVWQVPDSWYYPGRRNLCSPTTWRSSQTSAGTCVPSWWTGWWRCRYVGLGKGHGLLQSSPHPAFGMWDLRMLAEAPVGIPGAELIFFLPRPGMSLHSPLQARPL